VRRGLVLRLVEFRREVDGAFWGDLALSSRVGAGVGTHGGNISRSCRVAWTLGARLESNGCARSKRRRSDAKRVSSRPYVNMDMSTVLRLCLAIRRIKTQWNLDKTSTV